MRCRLAFVGYQAQGTLGRRIQNGWDEIPVNGRDGMGRSDTLKLVVRGVGGRPSLGAPASYVTFAHLVVTTVYFPSAVQTVRFFVGKHRCVSTAR
ncbi:hypothetical protein C9J85_12965 [Haloferax sp. wsp5]|nr:hypothetical protein C9J85_12965 [Haloferax sp. wsp5]